MYLQNLEVRAWDPFKGNEYSPMDVASELGLLENGDQQWHHPPKTSPEVFTR